MWIADRGGCATGQHASIELSGSDQRTFTMHMAVDETRHNNFAARIDLRFASVVVLCAYNSILADCDVAIIKLARYQIQRARVPDNQIGARIPEGLIDASLQPSPSCLHRRHSRCLLTYSTASDPLCCRAAKPHGPMSGLEFPPPARSVMRSAMASRMRNRCKC